MVFQRRDKYSVFGWIQIIILDEIPARPENALPGACGKNGDKRRGAENARAAKFFASPSGWHLCRNQNQCISSSVRSDTLADGRNMSLLTELGFLWGGCYNDAAPTALKQTVAIRQHLR